jgi:hypothetical protein
MKDFIRKSLQEKLLMKRTLSDLYKIKFGKLLSNDMDLPVNSDDYWKIFELNPSEIDTKGLIFLINKAENDIKSAENFSIEKLLHYIKKLKSELSSREQIRTLG